MEEQHRVENLFSLGCMLLLEVLWGILWLYTDIFRNLLPDSVNFDILFYISSLLLAFFSFLGFHMFFERKLSVLLFPDKRREFWLEMAALFLFALVAGSIFLCEKKVIYAGDQHMPLHAGWDSEMIFLGVSAVVLGLISYLCRKLVFQAPSKRGLWPFYFVLASAAGYAVYLPNTLNQYFGLYHANAYFHSVYRVVQLQPYDGVNTGVYGFYGIVLGPAVKLLGGSFQACVCILAVLTAACMLCYFYVLEHMSFNLLLRILGSVGIAAVIIASTDNITLQTYPGRILFQGYMLALLVWKEQKNRREKRLWKAVALVLGILSFVWGLETGAACVLALVGSEIVFFLQKHSVREGILWEKAACVLLWLPVSFVGAYVLVNFYNLAVAGKVISLKEFLFPFAGNPYVNDLQISLETFPSVWMLVCFLFFTAMACVLMRTELCGKRESNPRMIYLTGCTIVGIVQMAYYVNRSVRGNLFLILPACVLMIVCLTDSLLQKHVWDKVEAGNGLLRAVAASQILVLVLVAVMTVESTLFFETERRKARDMEQMERYLQIMQNEIPRDTPGLGIGVTELYSYLGWNIGYYGIDIPDFPVAPEAKEIAVDFLSGSEYLFVNVNSLMTVIEHTDGQLDDFYENHEVLCNYGFGVSSYTFYKKNGI